MHASEEIDNSSKLYKRSKISEDVYLSVDSSMYPQNKKKLSQSDVTDKLDKFMEISSAKRSSNQ